MKTTELKLTIIKRSILRALKNENYDKVISLAKRGETIQKHI